MLSQKTQGVLLLTWGVLYEPPAGPPHFSRHHWTALPLLAVLRGRSIAASWVP